MKRIPNRESDKEAIRQKLRHLAIEQVGDYKKYTFIHSDTTNLSIWDEEIGWSQMTIRNEDHALLSVRLELTTAGVTEALANELEVTFDPPLIVE